MSLTINGVTVKTSYYNTTKCEKIFFNDTLIFTSELAPGLYDANNNLLCTITAAEVNSGESLLSFHPSVSGKSVAVAVIPSGATETSEYTFAGLSSLIQLLLPDTLETLGDYTLDSRGSLQEVDFSKCINLKTVSSSKDTYHADYDTKVTKVD